MRDSGATRAVVILRERPDAPALVALHRLIGIGLSDLRHRAETSTPLVDVELYGNDHEEVAHTLRRLLAELTGLDHAVHMCRGNEDPGPEHQEMPDALSNILDVHASPSGPARRPEPAPGLVEAIMDATRHAVTGLRAEHSGPFCAYALLTTGEGLRPYLTVTLDGPHRWNLSDGLFAIVGDEWFARLAPPFDARGDLHALDDDSSDTEYAIRFASMEEALRRLDDEGFFGTGRERERVLLLVATMPPDESDAGFARRLNPPGALLDAWLSEAAEGA
ncbi:MAG: DUF4303 domain-containing protein [Nocardioidaceae bacterium]